MVTIYNGHSNIRSLGKVGIKVTVVVMVTVTVTLTVVMLETVNG